MAKDLIVHLKSGSLTLSANGDGVFKDLAEVPIFRAGEIHAQVARLVGGMASGKSSIVVRLDAPEKDGKEMVILWETSLAMLRTMMAGLEGAEAFDKLRPKGEG